MSIARDAGIISEAQQKEIDALFTGKDGKFDEEAFAEAFARELKRAFHETVQKRMEDVPTTKAGRALRRVADFIATLVKSFAFWRQERGLDPVTGQPLQAGQVLDAFLKSARTSVDEATRLDNLARAARAASLRATAEARDNAPTQTVVDEDGTVVAYHERGDRNVSAEDFARTFGIRLLSDGNARSQDTANVCYDTLLKLAKLMGVPQETLGIGGLLTLDISVVEGFLHPAFYATNNTIKLTIQEGLNIPEVAAAATIVHEWAHALDRIAGLGRDADPNVEITEETTGALSYGEGAQVREELLKAGKRMSEALRNTRFYERISNDEEIKAYDREDPDAQLFDPQEVFARALANYYLANERGRIPMVEERLGPTMEELDEVGPILREFFSALKVGVNETTGVQTLYHEASRGGASELDSVPKHEGIGEDVLDALGVMLRTGRETALYTREYGDVLLAFGRFRNQVPGLKGKGFLHVLEERTSKDGLSTPEAVEVFLKAVEAAVRGKENKALRQGNRHAIELNGYRAIVADSGDFREFITGYKILTNEEKEKRSGVETDAIRRSEDYNPAFYDSLRQEGAERLRNRIAQLLAGRQVPKSVEELEQELDDLNVAYYRLFNARKKAEENGASQEELDTFTKDMEENREKHKQVAKAKKKLNRQRAKERKLYGNLGEERRDHIKVWSGARQAYDRVDLRFIGTGTGGNNEGRGAYSSGVRGVAQDKYARGALASLTYTADNIPVVYDGKSMTLKEAYGLARETAYRNDEIDEGWMIREINYQAGQLSSDNAIVGGLVDYNELREWMLEEFENESEPLTYEEVLADFSKLKALPIERRMGYDYGGGFDTRRYEGKDDKIIRSEMRDFYVDKDRFGFVHYRDVEEANRLYEEILAKMPKDSRKGNTRQKKLELLDKVLPELPETRPAVMEQTWFTNRPEGDVSHLLNWFEAVTPEQLGWIVEGARKAGFPENAIAFLQRERIDDKDVLIEKGNRMPSGREMYMRLELIGEALETYNNVMANSRSEGDVKFAESWRDRSYDDVTANALWVIHNRVLDEPGKFASEFLVSADIDGMMYPVDYRHGNRDGRVSGWNYVAFSDEHLRVDHVYEYNPETDDFELNWHTAEGSGPRFTETPLGQELVARAFDAIMGSRVDLLLRPSRFYGNPYETRERNPRNALVTDHLHRDVDVSEPKGFATEVSAEISRFGTREGDPTLREIRARCGSKARFYEVLGSVYETAEAVRSGLADVVTGRERTMMENAGLQAADFIKHNATARATAAGRKLYLMGREFAWKLYQEDIAAAWAEVERQRRGRGDCGMIGGKCEGKGPSRHGERRWPKARRMR